VIRVVLGQNGFGDLGNDEKMMMVSSGDSSVGAGRHKNILFGRRLSLSRG